MDNPVQDHNAEFEEFIALAAHNLRESLRDVASFSQLLAETTAGRLDDEACMFLDRIRQGAARMESLLAGMVDYWADSASREPGLVSMQAVMRQVLVLAASHIAQRNAGVTSDPLPEVKGDFQALTKVLLHLIENALVYGDVPSLRIHVSAQQIDREWVFSVADNGPGIDPLFQDRIFQVFKRLHGRDYPGQGLGLAFCKKAVERQGGRMWVASTPGAGSTFYFTLPAGPLPGV